MNPDYRNCSCHLSPPCPVCTDPTCADCGEQADEKRECDCDREARAGMEAAVDIAIMWEKFHEPPCEGCGGSGEVPVDDRLPTRYRPCHLCSGVGP